VYRAELKAAGGFSKQVALKILNPEVSGVEEITQRLRDEARVLGLLRHRAIVNVDGLVQLGGRWAVVMEYVEGVDLRRLVQVVGPVPVGPALEIVEEVASALHVAWETPGPQGEMLHLLHRDIKPGNIQLTRRAEVKVLDFGIAKANFDTREAKTQEMMFGSLPYMAPERLEFIDTHTSDVYALGVVLTEMLTGEFWEKPIASEKRHRERLDEITDKIHALTHDGEAADDLCAFLEDALAFEHEDRLDAKEFKRIAHKLQRLFDEPQLSDWAEHVVPPLLENRELVEDTDLSGTLLVEQTTGGHDVRQLSAAELAERSSAAAPQEDPFPKELTPPAPDTATTDASPLRRRRTLLLGAVLLVIVFLGLVMVGGVVLAVSQFGGTAPVAPEVVAAPEPAPPPEPEEDTATVAEVPEPEPEPEPEPPPPPPRPRPAPPAKVEVGLVGGAAAAVLVVDGKRVPLPTSVKAGTYDVEADFHGRGLAPAGRVTIPKGRTATVNCDAGFRLCKLK